MSSSAGVNSKQYLRAKPGGASQKIEAGDTNITLWTLVRVADALDVDSWDLLA
jgi:hypothetical protein